MYTVLAFAIIYISVIEKKHFTILLSGIRIFLDSIVETYQNFRILQTRSKRSLLPIVGKALSFLFGTVSEDDLQSIKSNINKLAANQKKISHVVEESLTLLNDTREHVIQNRQAINNVN